MGGESKSVRDVLACGKQSSQKSEETPCNVWDIPHTFAEITLEKNPQLSNPISFCILLTPFFMELLHHALTYGPDQSYVSLHKEVGNNITVHADIVLLSDKFLEYQKTILDEFFAQLFDLTYSEDVLFDEIIDGFEMLLQTLNTKLETFASKITGSTFFDIRGSIQLFHHQDYIASLIGDVTLLVVR